MRILSFFRTLVLLCCLILPQLSYAHTNSQHLLRSALIAKIAYFEKDYQKSYESVLKIPLAYWDDNLYWMSEMTAYYLSETEALEKAFRSYCEQHNSASSASYSQSFLHLQRAKFGLAYDPQVSTENLNLSSWLVTFAILSPQQQKNFLKSIERNGYLQTSSARCFALHLAHEVQEEELKKKLVFSISEHDEISSKWIDICAQSLNRGLFSKALEMHLERHNLDQKALLTLCRYVSETQDRKSLKKCAIQRLLQEKWSFEHVNQASVILSRLTKNKDKGAYAEFVGNPVFHAERAFINKDVKELKKQIGSFSEKEAYRERFYYKACLHYCQRNWENASKEIQRLQSRYVLTQDERFLKVCILAHLSAKTALIELTEGVQEYSFTKDDMLFIQALILKNQGKISQSDALCAQLQEMCPAYWNAKKHIFF